MKVTCVLFLTVAACWTARADFSYSTTTKSSSGMMGGAAGNRVSKTYLKGQKMKTDSGDTVMIMDFDAQTLTHIDNNRKTYSVTKFSDVGNALSQSGAEIKIDVKETGQRKTINGYNATEVVLSMEMDSPQARQKGMKMRMEMDLWLASDVPGSQEVKAFYERNRGKFPWGAMMGGGRGDQSMQNGIAELQRKMADLKGVPVLQVMKMGAAGNEAQMAQMQQGMAQARAQLEEMKRQGKLPPQAEEMLKNMGGASSAGSIFETTLESSGFSGAAIPDSVFAIPAGYQQTERTSLR
jgi:hypothetical protein